MSASGGSPAQAVGKPPKISERAFRVAIGVLLGLAVVSAVGRTFARFYKFHRILLDDAFFYLAVVTLIAGTGLTYADVPFIYLQEYVEAGLLKPPPDLVPRLIHSEKIQDAATVLLVCTVFSIKFSFLFFFKLLIRQQKKLMIWWWTVLVLLVPIAAVVMVSDFIACSYFDDRIFGKSSSPTFPRHRTDIPFYQSNASVQAHWRVKVSNPFTIALLPQPTSRSFLCALERHLLTRRLSSRRHLQSLRHP